MDRSPGVAEATAHPALHSRGESVRSDGDEPGVTRVGSSKEQAVAAASEVPGRGEEGISS